MAYLNNLKNDWSRAPDRRSLRATIITAMVRWGVRGWPRGNPFTLARRARRVFELPNLLGLLASIGLKIERVESGSVRGEWIAEPGRQREERVLLFLHGGGYVSCSSKSHRPITAMLARRLPGRVFSVDYRLAPEHPFPAAVDDATAAFEWLVGRGIDPHQIAIAGDSAGGGLAVATLLRLRSLGQAMPACVVCLSPWVDLTGASAYVNSGAGSMFQPADIASFAVVYLHGARPETPEASPVFADLTGLPPFLIQVTRTELLADDAIRLDARATECGVASTLTIYPELPHVWQIYSGLLPEARLALDQAAAFIAAKWNEARPQRDASGSSQPVSLQGHH
jgi:epsilon-lactone hydrolase